MTGREVGDGRDVDDGEGGRWQEGRWVMETEVGDGEGGG